MAEPPAPGPNEKPPPYEPDDHHSSEKYHGPPSNSTGDGSKLLGGQCEAPPAYYDGVAPSQNFSPINPAYSGTNFPNYGSTVYIQQPQMLPTTQVVFVGGCPACRVGVLEDDFTCLGICMAIFFFPLGILCCLAMKQRRCPNCGGIFG